MIDAEDLEDRKKINFQKYQLPRFGFWYVWKLLLYIGMLIILLYFMSNRIKKHAEMEQLISETCSKLGIETINVEKDHRFPSMSHYVAMNHALNNYIKKDKDW